MRHRQILATTALATIVVLGAAACSDSPGDGPSPAQSTTAPAETPAQSPGETPASTPVRPPDSTPTDTSTPTTASSPGTTSSGPITGLKLGTTAHTEYFDVAAHEFVFGTDEETASLSVTVCYTKAHPKANSDGTTTVSPAPWFMQLQDGEGDGGKPHWVAVTSFPVAEGWSPPYESKQLRVGECNTGWMAMRIDNPDMMWLGARWSPADFPDQVVEWTW